MRVPGPRTIGQIVPGTRDQSIKMSGYLGPHDGIRIGPRTKWEILAGTKDHRLCPLPHSESQKSLSPLGWPKGLPNVEFDTVTLLTIEIHVFHKQNYFSVLHIWLII